MIFAPHILQVKSVTSGTDENGDPISGTSAWTTIGKCRCDDNTTKEFKTVNGDVYRPSYHIVYEDGIMLKAGDEIQCLNSDGTVRGSGKIYLPKMTNYFSYKELWV